MNCWAASRSHRRRARYIGRFPRPLDSMNVTAVLVIRPTRHFALTQRDRTSEQDMKATARIAAGKKRLEVIMSRFTIETTYRLPVYRQRTYEAETLDQACRLAIEDDDWSEQKEDYDCSGDTYVTGAWPGEDTAHSVTALTVPSQFGEDVQRKADHFETLLGVLKVLAHSAKGEPSDSPFWRQRADAAIAKAKAILAGACDPVIEGGAP